jgi:2-iminobutanoate/2-iminopropanoate deaminase
MPRTAVETERAPRAIGPYSQAVIMGPLMFLSGQVALDPTSGELVSGGIEAETQQVLDNLAAVLAAAGAGWEDVVKTTIYLTDLGHFQTVNTIYAARVRASEGWAPPARATVQVAALPKGALVEIDAIAYLGRDS